MLKSTKIILGIAITLLAGSIIISQSGKDTGTTLIVDCYTPKAAEVIEDIVRPIKKLGAEKYIKDYCDCIAKNTGRSWADDGTYSCQYINDMNTIQAKTALIAAFHKGKVKNKTLHCITTSAGVSEGNAQTILNIIFPPE